MKIKDIPTALLVFEESAVVHTSCTETGDYKTGNKAYRNIAKAVTYLKSIDRIDHLIGLLTHQNVGVRSWTASFLLFTYEKEAITVLEEIAQHKGIIGGNAETLLDEWKKGNLKDYL